MEIKTKRLILRNQIDWKDVCELAELLARPEIKKKVNMLLPLDKTQQQLAIQRMISTSHSLVIANKEVPQQVLGLLMVNSWIEKEDRRQKHHYELGYFIAPQVQNHGLMTEALQAMIESLPGGITLHAVVNSNNLRSQRVLKKCGFRKLDDQSWLLETCI